MISLKCKNCGGEMSIDIKGELACPYCGTKEHLSDVEFKEYKNFRLNMLHYLRASADAEADKADGTFLWEFHDSITYIAEDGTEIDIDYLFYSEDDNVKTYVAKDTVIHVFSPSSVSKVSKMIDGINLLDYPSADLKNLSKYFPTIKANIKLNDGGILLAIAKPENVYPLYAFGCLRPEHVAWIISRMENFCCVFEFSGMVQNGISINSVFINPRTHEAYLYGGWWNSHKKLSMYDKADLLALRNVAAKVVGEYKMSAPKEFREFLSSRPAEDAYSDFAMWDEVIEKGFGGHKFTKFSTN